MAIPRLEKALVIDWETSGLINERIPLSLYREGPQGIQIGANVVNIRKDWEVVDKFKTDVRYVGSHGKFIGQYPNITWDKQAEEIHRISMVKLAGAPHPTVAAKMFKEFLNKNFQKNQRILICGQNPGFDRYFTMQLLWFANMLDDNSIRFHYRMIDTFTIGLLIFGVENSDDLFRIIGIPKRETHDAGEDADLTTDVLRLAFQEAKKINLHPQI